MYIHNVILCFPNLEITSPSSSCRSAMIDPLGCIRRWGKSRKRKQAKKKKNDGYNLKTCKAPYFSVSFFLHVYLQ